ncbi:MAG TPA: lantibiotic dehydratase [Chitinophaga sp.]|uniref:lantibiotic dehydratase n=1 Tax=Chitinophaga sp. TaxID=1869181 RepID=UPI002BAB2CD8|nr:lantibiotic dehydratase [Chitinophaga sp.]HVI45111.1 lantibiotic dehydratase [Chitinophaga sp.]
MGNSPTFVPGPFILRTPALPFTSLKDLLADDVTEERLREIWSNATIREAIRQSSESLHNSIGYMIHGELDERKKEKVKQGLIKYLLRMCYRCTPFGLMAGVAYGNTGTETTATLQGTRTFTRPDMGYLHALVKELEQRDEIFLQMKLYPNNTIFGLHTHMRYVELVDKGISWKGQYVSVEKSPYIQLVLDHAREGMQVESIIKILMQADDELEYNDCLDFIRELRNSHILVNGCMPALTGGDAFSNLLTFMKEIRKSDATNDMYQKMQTVRQLLDSTAGVPATTAMQQYDKLKQSLKELNPLYQQDHLLQTDYINDGHLTLHSNFTEELKEVIMLLCVNARNGDGYLDEFKKKFTERYEDRYVPLLEVVDGEIGLGFPVSWKESAGESNFLKDVYTLGNVSPGTARIEQTPWSMFILEKIIRAIASGASELVLDKQEVAPFIERVDTGTFASLMYTFCNIYAASSTAIDEGDFLVAYNFTAATPLGAVAGRFCYMDEKLTDHVRDFMLQEEVPGKVYAEIVHTSQARIGNISSRPPMREYELPIVDISALSTEKTIALNDLYVSVRDNKVILFSEKLNKEVVPRLSCAHDYMIAQLSVYRFLCGLKCDNTLTNIQWKEPELLGNVTFLPRVRYGRTVIAKARWILQWKDLSDAGGNAISKSKWDAFRTTWRLPALVELNGGEDSGLLLDLTSASCMAILEGILQKSGQVKLLEVLCRADNLFHTFAGKPDQFYHNEHIIPWRTTEASRQQPVHKGIPPATATQRVFSPGSEWVYLKIYCHWNTMNKVLRDYIVPFISANDSYFDKWFFIRYGDPEPHIRLRFRCQGADQGIIYKRFNTFIQPALDNRFVWKVMTDTYVRELERYGHDNIENAESLFYADSMLITGLVVHAENYLEEYWKYICFAVKTLLDNTDMQEEEKLEFLSAQAAAFMKEFGSENRTAKKMLSKKYQSLRQEMERLLSLEYPFNSEITGLFDAYSRQVAVHIGNDTSPGKKNRLASYIHMHVNRVCTSGARLHEMVIYDLLTQYYGSLRARQKSAAIVQPTNLDKA